MAVRYGWNPILEQWVVLSEIMNGYPFASNAETLAGTVDVKAVTPASLASTKDVDGGIVGRDANGEIAVNGINIATDDLANPDPRNMTWNINDGTLDLDLYNGVVMQVGEEFLIYGKAIEDIPDGSVVMYGGALGDNIKLRKADASLEGFLPRLILGVATHNIDINKWGYVTKVGKVRGIDTRAFAEGAIVYFDPTVAGGLTATQPEAPCCKVPMGAILRSQTDGIIFVRPEFNPSMSQVNDVHIDTIADGHILKWDGTDERFENVPYPVTQNITNGVTTTAPSEDAVFDALTLKAPLASPALTGSPTAPTQTAGDNSTKIATTAYADAKVADSITDNVTAIAPSQNAVYDALALKAPLASPTFTGDVIVPDQTAGNNSTKAANTKYVDAKVAESITNGVTGIAPSQDVVYDELLIKEQVDNLTYAGVDLTTKFATEIAGYSDVWAWIKARITAVNYAGLNIGDYIPFTIGAETIWAQIAGIDTYYRTGNIEIGHHIDFISKDCMVTGYQWNTTDMNNGNATNAAPWMVSALKATLDGLVASLPSGLQSQIIEKLAFLETRYTSGSTLTNSTGWAWNNMGKLWVPVEHEVFGTTIWGTARYSSAQAVQYPIFANSYKSRVKGMGHNGGRSSWWLASVFSGYFTYCCSVSSSGYPVYYIASTALRVPLCFRIG